RSAAASPRGGGPRSSSGSRSRSWAPAAGWDRASPWDGHAVRSPGGRRCPSPGPGSAPGWPPCRRDRTAARPWRPPAAALPDDQLACRLSQSPSSFRLSPDTAHVERDHLNLPERIDHPQSLGEECVYLPLYLVRGIEGGRKVRYLAYSQVSDEVDGDITR